MIYDYISSLIGGTGDSEIIICCSVFLISCLFLISADIIINSIFYLFRRNIK